MAAPMENVDDNVVVAVRAGSNLVNIKPLFSFDSKLLFCCAADIIKVFSVTSGELVRSLQGHKDTVTGLSLNPHNKLQLLSCALDQFVIFWDYADGILLKKLRFTSPLHGIVPLGSRSYSIFIFHQRSSSSEKNSDKHLECEIRKCDLLHAKVREVNDIKSSCVLEEAKYESRFFDVGCQSKYIAACSRNKLIIKTLSGDGPKKVQKFTLEDKQHITCLACHPVEPCVATGTDNGTIYLWRNFLSHNKNVVKSKLHWHALTVLTLAFSSEGSYLISGGHECVLVKWQLESNTKDFLPRIGAPICHVTVSSDNQMYTTSHVDNEINVISSNFKMLQTFQGLTLQNRKNVLVKKKNLLPVGMLCDPQSKAVVLNGKPGHLQFYCVHTDKKLFHLDVVGQNYVSPVVLNMPLVTTEVMAAAFDTEGRWLATVEQWNDEVFTPEMRLKFWLFDEESQGYKLNTTVEQPHTEKIHCLKFRPHLSGMICKPMAVTTSADNKFKIWQNEDDTDIYRKNTKWINETVGYYHDYTPGRCAFSSDGSLLGIIFQTHLTVWNPETQDCLHTFTDFGLKQERFQFVEFGQKSCSHFLVATTHTKLIVWNLMSCTVAWTVPLKVDLLLSDSMSEVFAVCDHRKKLYIFRPSAAKYIYCHSQISEDKIRCGVFVPNSKKTVYSKGNSLSWQSESSLHLMTKSQELLTLSLEEVENERETSMLKLESKLPETAFSILLSNQRKRDVQNSAVLEDASNTVTAKQFTEEMLRTPAHVQPSVASLCKGFLQSLLLTSKKRFKENDTESSDNEMDAEERTDFGTFADSDSDMEVEFTQIKSLDTPSIQNASETVIQEQSDDIDTSKINLSWYKTLLEQ